MNDPAAWMTIVFIVLIYLLPGLIAYGRKHHQSGAILMLSLVLGWTLIGWLVALVWASTQVRKLENATAQALDAIHSETRSDGKRDHRSTPRSGRYGSSA